MAFFAAAREFMMRIVIANTQAPFVWGGAEDHARRLGEELSRAGHQVEAVNIPFNWTSVDAILDHAVAASSLDLSGFFGEPIDLMIGLRFPAYLMQHPRKVMWVLHQYREAYDLWDADRSGLRHDARGNLARQIIHDMDVEAFRQCKKLYANSANVAERMKKHNAIEAEALYHPPPLASEIRGGDFGDYIYFPSRISGLKRQGLVLDAMALTRSPVKLVLSGGADSSGDAEGLRSRIAELGLGERVIWRGHIAQADMLELYANACGVVFPPFDEDLGYITLEAMLASKPVITTTDSGGPLEFIRHEQEGLVVKPKAQAIADALDRLYLDREDARRLGAAGRQRYEELDISWSRVIAKLTGHG